jgi:hypothetical protein
MGQVPLLLEEADADDCWLRAWAVLGENMVHIKIKCGAWDVVLYFRYWKINEMFRNLAAVRILFSGGGR